MVEAVKKGMRGGCPVSGAGAPGSGGPRTLFLTAFAIDFLRFGGHFGCPVWVLGRDSFWGRVWYGLLTNLYKCIKKCTFLLPSPVKAPMKVDRHTHKIFIIQKK